MCSYLDGKSLRILELMIDLYSAVNKEAKRIGMKVDNSEIGRLIDEAKTLVIKPLSDDSYHDDSSDEDLTEPPGRNRRLSGGWRRLSFFDRYPKSLVNEKEIDRAYPVKDGYPHQFALSREIQVQSRSAKPRTCQERK